MMERRRQLMMLGGGLPSAYRKVEYLEGTGTQYIVTDYVPTAADFSADWAYMRLANPIGDEIMWGTTHTSGGTSFYAEQYGYAWYAGTGNIAYRNVHVGHGNQTGVVHTAHIDNNAFVVDTYSVSPTGEYTDASVQKMALFCWNANGTIRYTAKALRLYAITFYQGVRKVANFVPCVRKSDNKPGMYDTVSKTFFTNAGSGEFIVPER